MVIHPSTPNRLFFILFLLSFPFTCIEAQNWEFKKEENGIKIFTRKEPGNDLKSYRGITEIKAPAEKVFAMLEDVNHTDWWDKSLSQIKVLQYDKNVRARYYLIYDLPWPITDRDLCVDVKITIDNTTGERKVIAGPLLGVIPEKEGLIRIKNYHQTWIVTPIGTDACKVELIGFVDPAGSIPDWLSNMVIVDSPLKTMNEVKTRFEKK